MNLKRLITSLRVHFLRISLRHFQLHWFVIFWWNVLSFYVHNFRSSTILPYTTTTNFWRSFLSQSIIWAVLPIFVQSFTKFRWIHLNFPAIDLEKLIFLIIVSLSKQSVTLTKIHIKTNLTDSNKRIFRKFVAVPTT